MIYATAAFYLFLFFFRHGIGPALFYAHFYGNNAYLPHKNQKSFPSPEQTAREKRWAWASSLVDITLVALSVALYYAGFTKIYWDFSVYGLGYSILTLLILTFAQDIYFYLTHRWMHWAPFYQRVHYLHHTAKNPTPWSAFCVHPAEKLLELLFFPLALVLMPLHPLFLGVFLLLSTLINLFGHTGFELNPLRIENRGMLGLGSTPTFHNMHHQFVRCNYSLYFSYLDKLFGTEHAEYTETLASLTKR
jgi:sterol desaturase/sphingolipid hydroxylase (fatty acid hydroxylase superfamily)